MDVLIVTAPKDYNKLKFAYDSIMQNVDGVDEVVCISPVEIPDKYLPSNVFSFLDAEVLDFDFSLIHMKHRRGWYRQQFIKLFQEVTTTNYLVVDSDIFICRKLKISEKQPIFYLGQDQKHQPYFNLMKDLVNLDRVYQHSFICELMYFKKEIIDSMLQYLKVDQYEFFLKCVEYINKANDASGFSEYELYGNYTTKYFPGVYQYENLRVLHQAKKRLWTDDEIWDYIKQNMDKEYDILTMHSWI